MSIQLNNTPINELSKRDTLTYMTWFDIDVLDVANCSSVAKIRLALAKRYLVLDPTMSLDLSELQSEVDNEDLEIASRLQGSTGNK